MIDATIADGLPPGFSCGDFGIRILQDGVWHYQGSPINRLPLVKLFASVLQREADGSYWLVTPAERGRIEVEDAPFVAIEVRSEGVGRDGFIDLRTNIDDWVPLDRAHPLRIENDAATGAPRPYILVRAGLEARIVRSVFYHLVDLAVERDDHGIPELGLWSRGTFFSLGNLTAAI